METFMAPEPWPIVAGGRTQPCSRCPGRCRSLDARVAQSGGAAPLGPGSRSPSGAPRRRGRASGAHDTAAAACCPR